MRTAVVAAGARCVLLKMALSRAERRVVGAH